MKLLLSTSTFLLLPLILLGQFESDTLQSDEGEVVITFIGHGTLLIEYQEQFIHIDPWTKLADYSTLPPANLVLVTHHHGDHLDDSALDQIIDHLTELYWNAESARKSKRQGTVLNNGDSRELFFGKLEVVPAYNHKKKFHPEGRDNGYILNFPGLRIYVAGDTEDIPEMGKLGKIDVAFLPMNLPYTMSPEQAARAARLVNPDILYPYHYSDTNTEELVRLLEGDFAGEIRIRQMQ